MTAPMRLNLGSGRQRGRDGYVTLDADPRVGADITATVPPIPMADQSCERVLCSHMLEHLDNETAFALIADVWRVLLLGGEFEVAVPYALSHAAIQDPTHVSQWVPEKFLYCSPHFGYLAYPYERRFQVVDWSIMSEGSVGLQLNGEVRVVLRKIADPAEPCHCPICRASGGA